MTAAKNKGGRPKGKKTLTKAHRKRAFRTWRTAKDLVGLPKPKHNVSGNLTNAQGGPAANGQTREVLTQAERRYQAFDLFTKTMPGASYAEIGRQLGVSSTTAQEDIWSVADELAAESTTLAMRWRPVQVIRLERLILANWADRKNPGNARIIIQALTQQARLLGTEAPIKVAPTNPDGTRPYAKVTLEDIDRRLRELALEAQALDTADGNGNGNGHGVVDVEPEPKRLTDGQTD